METPWWTPPNPHSNPQVFLTGTFRYRSTYGVLGAAMCLLMGAGFAFPTFAPQAPIFFRVVFGVFSALALAAGVYLGYLFTVRRIVELRVTEEGIVYTRLHPWSNITRVEGVFSNGGVVLRIVGRRFPITRSLPTLPAMTETQFKTLIAQLQENVLPRYPRLTLDADVRRETD